MSNSFKDQLKKVQKSLKSTKEEVKPTGKPTLSKNDLQNLINFMKKHNDSFLNNKNLPVKIELNEKELLDFYFDFYTGVLKLLKRGREYNGLDESLGFRISFNIHLEPFVGESDGYNQEIQREYIKERVLIEKVKHIIVQLSSTTGRENGRFFFSNTSISYKDPHKGTINFITWDFPDSNDFKQKVKEELRLAKEIVEGK